jgi:hypothetical protein
MKAKGKRVGTKAQIRAMKEKERRIATAILLIVILLAVGFSGYFAYTILVQPSQPLIEPSLQFKPENPNSQLKAAIVDHLSLALPNETFVQTAATILTKANYKVDYFSGEKVTVGFYRNLPTYGYGIIILRVHSTASMEQQGKIRKGRVVLFTSELYSTTRYVQEQLADEVSIVSYSGLKPASPENPDYFGIPPSFVESCMQGTIQKATIIMMGCNGLNNTGMAQAFTQKGAEACIGWTETVSAGYTDTATTQLLKHLITEKQTIGHAVENTMNEVGPDPTSKSVLEYYPLEARDQTIESKG